ncbi:MAG: hypothetical protein QOJ32_236 [Frankiaceae bacterium]|nr:hypothetical protein [Frankiaceae bacterium]
MWRPRRRAERRTVSPRQVHVAIVGLVAAFAVGGCTLPGRSTPSRPPTIAAQAAAPATARWSVADRGEIPAGSGLSVTAEGGLLRSLDVTDRPDHHLPSSTDGLTGRATELPPGSTVTAVAVLASPDGREVTASRTIRVAAPPRSLRATVSPGDGAEVGVGQPVIVTFNTPVADRAAAERALRVVTDRPVGEAGWYWFDNSQVQYRPQRYWPSGTKVTVTAALSGVRTGTTTWGVKDTTSTFTIGRSQVLRIDDATHRMTVVRDGATIRTVPVSLGRHQGSFITRSGTKTVMAIQRTVRMDSRTVGITGPDAYNQVVPFAMRLTWSGEFIHGAPWSEWAQGQQDVSHGCTNVSLANAEWLFNNSLVGDPVETTGTGREMEPGNGWGGGWNVSWAEWKAGSALR